MKNIIFFGAPGSGKGTQSLIISSKLDIPIISTGNILRKEVNNESKIGLKVKSYLDSGKLVPDSIMIDMIRNVISSKKCDNGFILDGFPRNLNQAISLSKMLKEINKEIHFVININVSDDVIIKRVTGRFICKKCGEIYNMFFKKTKIQNLCDKCRGYKFESRSDDIEEVVINRLKIYHDLASNLIEFYSKNGLIYNIDGLKSSDSVSKNIMSKLNF